MKLEAGTEIRARALLFDMDGTLVGFDRGRRAGLEARRRQVGRRF